MFAPPSGAWLPQKIPEAPHRREVLEQKDASCSMFALHLVLAALPAVPKTILAESRDEWRRRVVPPSIKDTKHNFANSLQASSPFKTQELLLIENVPPASACGRFSIKSNAHFASIVFLCFAGGSPFVVVINIINLALPCGQGLATFAEEDNEGGINVAKPLPLFPLFPVLHRPIIHSGTIIDAFK